MKVSPCASKTKIKSPLPPPTHQRAVQSRCLTYNYGEKLNTASCGLLLFLALLALNMRPGLDLKPLIPVTGSGISAAADITHLLAGCQSTVSRAPGAGLL